MGAVDRLIRRLGYVRLGDYGLALSPDDRVVALRDGSVVGRRTHDADVDDFVMPVLAPAPLVTAKPAKPTTTTTARPAPAPAPVPAAKPVLAAKPAPAPKPAPATKPEVVEEDDWEWTIAIARARAAAEEIADAVPPELAPRRARAERQVVVEAPRAVVAAPRVVAMPAPLPPIDGTPPPTLAPRLPAAPIPLFATVPSTDRMPAVSWEDSKPISIAPKPAPAPHAPARIGRANSPATIIPVPKLPRASTHAPVLPRAARGTARIGDDTKRYAAAPPPKDDTRPDVQLPPRRQVRRW
jgi:hypothetical protein